MLNYQVKAFEKKERNRSRIELQMLLLKSWVFLVLYLVDYAVNIFSNLSILYMMPFGDCTVRNQLHYPLDESHKEDLMLFTGLLIGCGKKVKFSHTCFQSQVRGKSG